MASYIVWADYYSVGNASIDAEHRQIIDSINELYVAMQGPHNSELTKRMLDRMTQYARFHFDHEEKLLREANYPDFVAHKAMHDGMRRRTMALRENLTLVTARDVLVFLKDWWVDHIQSEDKKYAPYLVVQHAY